MYNFRGLCLLFLLSLCFLLNCGSGPNQENETDTIKEGLVTFENQSQFKIDALYVHAKVDNYITETNRVSQPLVAGQSITFTIPLKPWYVTVYRQPNKDSSVLAYTTADAWNPQHYRKLIYFDEQFRSADKQ